MSESIRKPQKASPRLKFGVVVVIQLLIFANAWRETVAKKDRHEVFKTDSDLDIFTVVSLYNTVYIWAGLIFLWACVSLVKNPKGQKDSSP